MNKKRKITMESQHLVWYGEVSVRILVSVYQSAKMLCWDHVHACIDGNCAMAQLYHEINEIS